jgi:hypothetical protein
VQNNCKKRKQENENLANNSNGDDDVRNILNEMNEHKRQDNKLFEKSEKMKSLKCQLMSNFFSQIIHICDQSPQCKGDICRSFQQWCDS